MPVETYFLEQPHRWIIGQDLLSLPAFLRPPIKWRRRFWSRIPAVEQSYEFLRFSFDLKKAPWFLLLIKFSCKHEAISKGKGISARWGFSSNPGGWDCAIRLLNSWRQNFNVKVKHFFRMEEKEGFPFTRCLWKFKKQRWSRLSTRRASLRSKLFLSPSLPPPLPGYFLSNTWKRLILSCKASSRAFSVNAFLWRIRDIFLDPLSHHLRTWNKPTVRLTDYLR